MSELKASNPLHFQDEFLRAKRNLMWFSSLSILLFFAGISTQDNNNLTAPLLSISINIDYLIILNFVVCIYHLFGFVFAEKRQRIFNSDISYMEKFKSIDDVLSTILKKIEDPVDLLSASVGNLQHQKKLEGYCKRIKEYKGLIDEDSKIVSASSKKAVKLSHSFSIDISSLKSLIHEDNTLDLQKLRNFANREYLHKLDLDFLDSHHILHESETALKNSSESLMWSIMQLEQAQDYMLSISSSSKNLMLAQESLQSIQRSFDILSDNISKNDKSKLIWFDNRASYFMFFLAIATTVAHFCIKYDTFYKIVEALPRLPN